MILSAHQPTYLPWCGLLHKIACADLFCILDTVQFGGKSYENRNTIKTQAGPLMLTVPVESGLDKTGGTVRIIPGAWQRKHVRSIQMAYAKAPFFSEYGPGLIALLEKPYERLADLNREILGYLLKNFGIATPIVNASAYDFRGEKSELVLDMCRKLGASSYIFGSQGHGYADVAAFTAAGVRAHFQEYKHPIYPQLHGAFASHLSAIDLLFNVGPGSREVLMRDNATSDHYT